MSKVQQQQVWSLFYRYISFSFFSFIYLNLGIPFSLEQGRIRKANHIKSV